MFGHLSKCNVVQGLDFVKNFQHFHLYSTTSSKAVIQSFTDYLVNDLGFTQKQALSTSTKLQSHQVNALKFYDNANSVVHFLKQHDFDDTHLRKIVSFHPKILFSKVDKTLKPKFKLLQDLGFCGSNLITVFLSNPTFVAKHMNHIFSYLRTILGSNENMLKFVRKSVYFTTSRGLEYLVSNVALLENDYGVDIKLIQNGILQQPRSFLRKPEFFRNIVVRVEKEIGIPCDSKMFFYGIHLLSNISEKNIESKCQLLRSVGWTEYRISDLMRRNPCIFTLSYENMRKSLDFLVNELGLKPDFIVSHSALFTYSLEKRLLPRHRVLLILKEKGLLDCNYYSACGKTEAVFLRIVERFQDVEPGLLEIYQNGK